MTQYKYILGESEMPRHWYNVVADMIAAGSPPPPPIHPATHEPLGPDALAPLFPMELIKQEASTDRYIPIPGRVPQAEHGRRPGLLQQGSRGQAHYHGDGSRPVGERSGHGL